MTVKDKEKPIKKKNHIPTEEEFLRNQEEYESKNKVVRYYDKGKWHEIPIKDDNENK